MVSETFGAVSKDLRTKYCPGKDGELQGGGKREGVEASMTGRVGRRRKETLPSQMRDRKGALAKVDADIGATYLGGSLFSEPVH